MSCANSEQAMRTHPDIDLMTARRAGDLLQPARFWLCKRYRSLLDGNFVRNEEHRSACDSMRFNCTTNTGMLV